MTEFYSASKLLSLKDINGGKPEIYICCGNKAAGKTVSFSSILLKRFIKNGMKFMLLYRYQSEISDAAVGFFKDIGRLFFDGHEMTGKQRAKGLYTELFYDGSPCGYAVSLNVKLDSFKRKSHLFSDTSAMFMDEFQSETGDYLTDEVQRLHTIHTAVARGGGQQVRYVPVYLVSNNTSLINPYFVEFGISNRLRSDTKFLKGDGFVMEHCYNESAAEAQKESAFNRAFQTKRFLNYSAENVYLNDNLSFVSKMEGKTEYLATIRHNGRYFAVREVLDQGILYVDQHADKTFPTKLSATTGDHAPSFVMMSQYSKLINLMRFYFERGLFRFADLFCKEAVINMLKY